MTGTDEAMVALTAVSVVVSIAAVAVARGSRSIADDALWTAQDANQIATGANQIAEGANLLADESNDIARSAAQDAREAPINLAWDELLAAVAAIQTFDPASSDEPVRPLLTAMRTRATLLIDKVAWPDFDVWVQSEVRVGLLLMREAADAGHRTRVGQGNSLTADQALAIDAPFHAWVAAFTSNLRRFRKVGPEGDSLAQLTEVATEHIKTIAARNGWPEPPDTIPGLATLQDDSS